MKTIVIGAGYWGVNYIKELAGNAVGVVEVDADRAEYVKQHYNVPVFPEVPEDLVYDAAIVATPPLNHVDVALPILKQGKYVLVEKPFSTSVEEMLKLRSYKDKVMAGMIYLYNLGIEELKEVVQNKPIHHAFSRRTNDGPVRQWQDAMWDLASHDISIFNYIFNGNPIAVEAMGTRDWCLLRLDYHLSTAVVYVSWIGGPKIRTVELALAFEPYRVRFDDVGTVYSISPMRRMLDDFLTGKWDERCSFDAGLEVIQVLEAASRLL